MDSLRDQLSYEQLVKLREAYRQSRDRLMGMLRGFLPDIYGRSRPYVTAISDAFYGDLPEEDDPFREALSAADRERCLIALLTSRREDGDLAIHTYMGLMEGISPQEIGNIIFLAGIYTGADNFARGLQTELATLKTLADMLATPGEAIDAVAVVTHLRRKFPG